MYCGISYGGGNGRRGAKAQKGAGVVIARSYGTKAISFSGEGHETAGLLDGQEYFFHPSPHKSENWGMKPK